MNEKLDQVELSTLVRVKIKYLLDLCNPCATTSIVHEKNYQHQTISKIIYLFKLLDNTWTLPIDIQGSSPLTQLSQIVASDSCQSRQHCNVTYKHTGCYFCLGCRCESCK